MVFQLLNNIKFSLAVPMDPGDLELVVMDDDLSDAERYDPTKVLSLTLVGDEELNDYEIVYAVSRTGTTFEVTRGEETTTAGSWPAGTQVIAALTKGVLEGTISAPTNSDQITYGGGNFGTAGTVEDTLDDMGDAIITMSADTDYYDSVQQRVGGGLFSGGVIDTVNLRWQGSAKKFTTAGLGVVVSTEASIAKPTVPPDVVIALRCADITNYGSIVVTAYNTAVPTSNMVWNIGAGAIPQNNAWLLAYGGAADAALSGNPSVDLPDKIKIDFKDNGTGVLAVSINHVDIVPVRQSYLGSFIRVASDADFDKVNTIAKYGFQVSAVITVEALVAGTLNVGKISDARLDGHRFYLTSPANFKAQSANQVTVKLFQGVRESFNKGFEPYGWVYNNAYNGPLDLDANTTVRELVSLAYPSAVGVGKFRSAIEVYRFTDPLYVAANLADAQAVLTGADKRAINIDLSALTVANLDTLYAAIVTSKNFYVTTLDYQNADNLKSGTVDPARLPIVPVSKGGTGTSDPVAAEAFFGVVPIGVPLPFAGATAPAGWVLCDGRLLIRATYPRLFAVIGTVFGSSGATDFRVPDLRGFVVAGRDNMGTGAAGRLTNISSTLGTVGGEQSHVLSVAEMPSHSHGGVTGINNTDHVHAINLNTGGESATHGHAMPMYTRNDGGSPVPGSWAQGGSVASVGNQTTGGEDTAHVHNVSGNTGNNTTDHTHNITAQGSGTAHNNTQLTMVLNWIIRAV